MSDDLEFQDILRSYAAPVADNGFTAATLMRVKDQEKMKWRLPILAAACVIGGGIAASQLPWLWGAVAEIKTPMLTPTSLTALGVLGYVVWAALDRGWSDTV